MALEVEAKLRVESHEPVRERLRALRATCLGCVLETNEILDHSDGSLRRRGCGLRVRSALHEQTGKRQATLTYKGPARAGPFKSREELEVGIDDAVSAMRLLAALGFVRILRYEKRRERWRLEDCRVELDEPPHLGRFVEIEGPDEAAIRAVQARLGLASAVHVRESYVHMLTAYCEAHGITDRTLTLSLPAPPLM